MPVRDAGVVDAGGPTAGALPDPCEGQGPFGNPLTNVKTPEEVATGFGFIEGPVWHAGLGVLFFSDMDFGDERPDGVASKIWRLTPPGQVEVFVADSGSNGIAITDEGALLAATHDAQTLSYFDPLSGARRTLALDYEGKAFNSPNDLVLHRSGSVFFTDPDWQLRPREAAIDFTGVYRYREGRPVELIWSALRKPNGIALSPAEDVLYVGSNDNNVLVFPVAADGTPGVPRIFASPGPSDGMTVDCAGNLYVTSAEVVVYTPEGGEVGRIALPKRPSNVAFGGPDARTLYITARESLYRVRLAVPGRPY